MIVRFGAELRLQGEGVPGDYRLTGFEPVDDLDPHTPADPAKAHSLTQLRMARTRHPVEPLFTGEWA